MQHCHAQSSAPGELGLGWVSQRVGFIARKVQVGTIGVFDQQSGRILPELCRAPPLRHQQGCVSAGPTAKLSLAAMVDRGYVQAFLTAAAMKRRPCIFLLAANPNLVVANAPMWCLTASRSTWLSQTHPCGA